MPTTTGRAAPVTPVKISASTECPLGTLDAVRSETQRSDLGLTEGTRTPDLQGHNLDRFTEAARA